MVPLPGRTWTANITEPPVVFFRYAEGSSVSMAARDHPPPNFFAQPRQWPTVSSLPSHKNRSPATGQEPP